MTFADHFSRGAAEYSTYRPRYPEALFTWLAGLPAARGLAWDCATGNGQAAVGLAPHFDRVIATDASAGQIEQAESHSRVAYRVAPADHSGLDPSSVDLVTVAQALHWFDLQPFFDEVRRVLAPGGVLAAWTYRGATLDTSRLTRIVERFMLETLGPHWAPARALVNSGYRTIPFPFEEIEAPSFTMSASWTSQQLLGYVSTWSAVSRFRAERGEDPMPAFEAELAGAWGAASSRRVTWPIALRVGRPR